MSNSSRVGGWLLAAVASLSFFLVETPSRAGTLAQFRTYWGDIEVELYDTDKPITVANFIRYVQSGRYENMFFHRCPTNPVTGLTDFVVQGGGYFVTNLTTAPAISVVQKFGTIPNEYNSGQTYSNVYGTIAMAKVSGLTNSASSEWFFNLKDNLFLDAPTSDGFFTVFGHVVRGTNVMNFYRGRSLYNGLQDLGSPFSELPVIYSGMNTPTFGQLEYVDITLLSVEIALTNNLRQVSWNSVSGLPNVVEYTTTMPPAWSTLVSTNGTGSRMAVIDPTATNQYRFYRVRVIY